MTLKNITNLRDRPARTEIRQEALKGSIRAQPKKENTVKLFSAKMTPKKSDGGGKLTVSFNSSQSSESSRVTRSRSGSTHSSEASPDSQNHVIKKRPFQLHKEVPVLDVSRESITSNATNDTTLEYLKRKPFKDRVNASTPTQSFVEVSFAGSEADSVVSENSSLFKTPAHIPKRFNRIRKIKKQEEMPDVSFSCSEKEVAPSTDTSTCSVVADSCVPFRKARKRRSANLEMKEISIENSTIENEVLGTPAQRHMFPKRRKTEPKIESTKDFADVSMASSDESEIRDATFPISEMLEKTITPRSEKSLTRASVKSPAPKLSESCTEESMTSLSIHVASINSSMRSELSDIPHKRPFSESHIAEKSLSQVSIAKSPADPIPESPASQEVRARPFSIHQEAGEKSLEDVGYCKSQEPQETKGTNPDVFSTPFNQSPRLTRSRSRNTSTSLKSSAGSASLSSTKRRPGKKSFVNLNASVQSQRSSASNDSNVLKTPAIVHQKATTKFTHSVTTSDHSNSNHSICSNTSSAGRRPIFAAKGAEMADVTYCLSQPLTESPSLSSTKVQNRPFSGERSVEDSIDCISFCASQPMTQESEKLARPFSKHNLQQKSMADVSLAVSPNLNETEGASPTTEGLVTRPFARTSALDGSLPEIQLALSQNSDSPQLPLKELQNLQNGSNLSPSMSMNGISVNTNKSMNASLMSRRKSMNKSLRVIVQERARFRRLGSNASFPFPDITLAESSASDSSETSNESKESSDESKSSSSSEESKSSSSSEASSLEEEESEKIEESVEEEDDVEEPAKESQLENDLPDIEDNIAPPESMVEQTLIEEDPLRASVCIPSAIEEFSSTRECSADVVPHDDLSALSLDSTAMSMNHSFNKTVITQPPKVQLDKIGDLPSFVVEKIQEALRKADEKDKRLRMQFSPDKQTPPRRKQPAGKTKKVAIVRVKKYKPDYWASRRLYNFLEKELSHYKLDRVLKAEAIVKTMHSTFQKVMKSKSHEIAAINELKVHLAKEKILRTTDDFYKFIDTYLPPAFCDKVIPCLRPFTGIVWPPVVGHKRPDEPILD